MKIYRTKIFILVILCSIVMSRSICAQNSLDSLIQTLPETCRTLMQQRGWPSLSVAIVLDQKIIYSEAFGYADIDRKIPATTKTIYRIASMTKLFTATMLMQLAERGNVNINDPLIKYLPDYKPKYPINSGPTTLRQLATHTAGLHVDAAQGFWHYLSNLQWVVSKGKEKIDWGITKNDLLSSFDKVEIEYAPNMYPNYSNFGFQLLGIALETAAHESFEKYIKSNILDPLDMKNSDFNLNDEQKARYAVGYTYLEPDFQRFISPIWQMDILKYSGGLYSTPEDIARFISFQFRDQKENNSKILSGDGLRFMRSQQTLRNPQTNDAYGIGWSMYDYEGYQVINHAGGHWGFASKTSVLPDLKLGVVVMTNCNYPGGYIGPDKEFTRIIYEKFIPILKKKKIEIVFNPQKVNLQKYSGEYALPGDYAHAELKVVNDTLYFSLMEKPEFNAAIQPVGLYQFCFATDPGKHSMFVFSEDDSGKIINLIFLGFNFKKVELLNR